MQSVQPAARSQVLAMSFMKVEEVVGSAQTVRELLSVLFVGRVLSPRHGTIPMWINYCHRCGGEIRFDYLEDAMDGSCPNCFGKSCVPHPHEDTWEELGCTVEEYESEDDLLNG